MRALGESFSPVLCSNKQRNVQCLVLLGVFCHEEKQTGEGGDPPKTEDRPVSVKGNQGPPSCMPGPGSVP